MTRCAVLLLLVAAQARAQEWKPPTRGEALLAGAGLALIAADVAETRFMLHNRPKLWEQNPLLGPHPSDVRLLATSGLSAGALGLAWYAAPPPWRSRLACFVALLELGQVGLNAALLVHGSF